MAKQSRWDLHQPPSDVAYHRMLAGPTTTVSRSMLGILTGILALFVIVPAINQGLVWLTWVFAGWPGEFTAYADSATAYETPGGMLSGLLAIALLTAVAAAIVALIHNTSPRWLISVQGAVRWRYLIVVAIVAVIILNAALWASRWDTPWNPRPDNDPWVFLVVILVVSPLQAVGEEVFFRGYVMQAFGSMVKAPWFAITTSALVFALLHGSQNVPLFLDRFGFGLLAGVLVSVTGGLEAGVAAHVVNNLFAFGYAAIESSVAEAKAIQEVGWVDAAFDLGGFAAFTIAAIVIGRRFRLHTRTPARA